MFAPLPPDEALLRRGKWTYISALLLIGALTLCAHSIVDTIIQRQADTGLLINLSGRQRMLSQRIVKIAIERALHRVPRGDAAAQRTLREALELMITMHNGLMSGSPELHLLPPPAPIREIYTGQRWKLDAQMQSFFVHARVLANEPTAALSLNDPDLVAIEEEARTPLLNALEAAVVANQEYSERSTARLRNLLAVLTASMLVILLAEALLLFRPLFRRLSRQQRHLLAIGRTDPLTGCFNRRAFEELALAAMDSARRANEPLSLLSLDLDHFKAVNDTHGHAGGDLVLQTFASTVLRHIRSSDLLCRIGGEEFVLLLPRAAYEDLASFANRLRERVERIQVAVGASQLHITVSMGGATLHPLDASVADLLARADLALYAAKRGGRNRVEVAPIPVEAAAPNPLGAVGKPLQGCSNPA